MPSQNKLYQGLVIGFTLVLMLVAGVLGANLVKERQNLSKKAVSWCASLAGNKKCCHANNCNGPVAGNDVDTNGCGSGVINGVWVSMWCCNDCYVAETTPTPTATPTVTVTPGGATATPTLTPTPGGSSATATPTSSSGGFNWCRDATWSIPATQSEKLAGVCCYRNTSANACNGVRYARSKVHPYSGLADSTVDNDENLDGCYNPSSSIDIWCCKTCSGSNGAPYHFVPEPSVTQGGATATPTRTASPTPTSGANLTPTPSPTPGQPGSLTLVVAARVQGFDANHQPQALATIKAKNTSFSKTFILPESGVSEEIDLTGLQAGQNYDFVFTIWGFLTIKKNITLVAGRNPDIGEYLLGTFKTGDLNGDNQVNGLDYSLMKLGYGQNGGQ